MVSVVSPLVWAVTCAALLALILLDLTVIGRRQRTVTTRDAVRWVLFYIGLAALFAVGRRNQKPIRKYEHKPTASQKTKSSR